jgi:hypothetical protein
MRPCPDEAHSEGACRYTMLQEKSSYVPFVNKVRSLVDDGYSMETGSTTKPDGKTWKMLKMKNYWVKGNGWRDRGTERVCHGA